MNSWYLTQKSFTELKISHDSWNILHTSGFCIYIFLNLMEYKTIFSKTGSKCHGLNCVPQKKICWSAVPQNTTLFRDKILQG